MSKLCFRYTPHLVYLFMADNKEQSEKREQSVYKFGQKELDLNKYIHNLGTNLQSYMDRQKHWSEGQRQEFVNAYNTYIQGLIDQRDNNTNRFYTDDAGQIYDSSGILSNTDTDGGDYNVPQYYYDDEGNQINASDYDQLRRRKQKRYNTFSANREVASYFNQIGRALSPYEQEKKEKFDVSKHGFIAHWNNANNKSGEKMELRPFLDMDKYDAETGKRARTNRLQYLQKQLQDYIAGLEDNYDWKDASYKSMDEYKASLQNLLNHMSDGTWDNNDEIAANQAGIGGSFYNAFFTEDEHPNLSDEDRDKLDEEREQKARDEAWQSEVRRRYDIYSNNRGNWNSENPYYLTLNDYNDENGNFNVTKWADSFDSSHPYYREIKQDGNYKNYFKKFFENPFVQEASRVLPYLLSNQQYARQLQDGRYYIAEHNEDGTLKDKDTNSVLIYDPTKGTLSRNFIGDVEELWNEIKSNYGHSQGWSSPYERYYKEGGSIDFLQFGGGIDINANIKNSLNTELNQRAQTSGKNVKEQKADERRVGLPGNRAENTVVNNAKFTDVEYARIGSAIADIGAIGLAAAGAFTAGVGTAGAAAAGLGSTGLNLYADIRDKGVSGWQTLKNLGLNLGMDIVGLIPGGGAASKGAKVLKSIGKIIPKVMLTLSATSAFANREEIMASLQKATSNPKDMNVGDWQNLAQALSLVSGASQVAGAAYNKKAKNLQADFDKAIKVNEKIVVGVKDASGNTRSVLFDGDDAKAIRAAREKGGKEGVGKINEILEKYENTQGWTVQQETKNGLTKGDKWWKPKYGDTGEGEINVRELNADGDGLYLDNGLFKTDQRVTQPDDLAEAQLTTLKSKNGPVDTSESIASLTKDDTLEAIAEQKAKAQQDIIESLRPDLDSHVAQKKQAELDLQATREKIADYKSKIGTDTHDAAASRIAEIAARQATPEYATRKQALDDLEVKIRENQTKLDDLDSKLKAMNSPEAPVKPKGVRKPSEPVAPVKPADYDINPRAKAKYDIQKAEYDVKVSKYETARKAYEVRKAELDQDWINYEHAVHDYKKAKKAHDQKVNTLNKKKQKLSEQLAADKATVETEQKWLGDSEKRELEGRLGDLQARERALKDLEDLEKAQKERFDSFVGNRPDSYNEWIRLHSDLDGNILWDLPRGRKSEAITKEAFEEILKSAGITFNKQGGALNINNVRKFYLGGTSSITNPAFTGNGETDDTTKENSFGSGLKNIFNNLTSNPTLSHGLPRAIYSDIVNRKLTDMSKDSEKPFFKQYSNLPTRVVTSDLNSETQGYKNAAAINNMASHAITSDADKQMAMQLDAAIKGQEFINQGLQQSNTAIKESQEQAFQEKRAEADINRQIADANRLSAMQTAKNKDNYEMAYESSKHKIYDTLWQQHEYDLRQKQAENKEYARQFANREINGAVDYDLENIAKENNVSLTPEQLQIWNEVVSGAKNVSDLEETDRNNYMAAYNIAEQLKSKMLQEFLGIPSTRWGRVRQFTNPEDNSWFVESDPASAKKGAKLEIARMRERGKDADRFQKSMRDYHNRHQKMLDKLSDSIYGFINASID